MKKPILLLTFFILLLTFHLNASYYSVCASANLTLEITFDNRPQDIAFEIAGANQTSVAVGFGYDNEIPGSTLSIPLPVLSDGDYALKIFDRNGDGLCCTNGNGSYRLKDGTTTILSGDIFVFSEIQTFCVNITNNGVFDTTPPTTPVLTASNPTASTVDLSWTPSTDAGGVLGYVVFLDGTYIGDTYLTSVTMPNLSPGTTYDIFVAARDITGNFSAPSNTVTITTTSNVIATTIHEGYFESGLDGWIDGGNDCARVMNNKAYEGDWSVMIRDNSGYASSMTSPAFDLTPYDSVTISFHYFAQSMELSEDFWLRFISNGSWNTIKTYEKGVDFNSNGFYTASITLDNSNFNTNNKFRFQCDASANNDKIFIDAVIITAYSTNVSNLREGNPTNRNTTTDPIAIEKNLLFEKGEVDATIFPNPSADFISIQGISTDNIQSIAIYDLNGRMVKNLRSVIRQDISELSDGIYFIKIITHNGMLISKRLLKQTNH